MVGNNVVLHFGGKTVDVMVGNIGALRRENCGC